MAGTFYPVYSGNQLVVYVLLKDMANTGRFKANPTIATGDFKYSADGGAAVNVDAQAVQTDTYWVKLTINAGNAVGDYILIRCIDQTSPPEWADFGFAVPTHLANIPANVTQWLGQAVQAAVNGFPKVDLTYLFGTILSESAGVGALAGAFIKFFNKATPTGTINSLPDAVPQAANGLITSAAGSLDIDDLAADVDVIETRVTTALPNAAPQAAGGLITSIAGSLDLDGMNADIEAIQTSVAIRVVRTGTLQGANNFQAQLDAGASATTGYYVGMVLVITGGAGVGQSAMIATYTGSNKEATLVTDWVTQPDNSSTYALLNAAQSDVALWQGAQPNTVNGNGDLLAFATNHQNIAGEVWDILASGHVDVGTFGRILQDISIAVPTADENAEALLKYDWTLITGEADRSALNALRFLRNAWLIVATTLHVKKEDDSTDAWTGTVTTNASADPITGNDPS